MRRSREPLLWALFSTGGMAAALIFPALVGILWVAGPLGWVAVPTYDALRAALDPPLVRVALAGITVLSLFHWAHRFRYTLYDGLQLYHLNKLIAVVTYGAATVLALVAFVVLFGAL